jgi:hypothetical protein
MKKKTTIDFLFNHKKIKNHLNNYDKVHVIAGFFVFFALIIIWKMFSYTVIHYDFYHTLADNQQI